VIDRYRPESVTPRRPNGCASMVESDFAATDIDAKKRGLPH
jgi:hypothetical protein